MWLIPSSMRSAFALASGCSTKELQLDSDTWALNCATFCTLNGKHPQQASLLRSWKRGLWSQRLYGAAISPRSQPLSLEAWLISSLLVSLARISASPAAGLGSTASALGYSSASSTLPTIAVRGSSFWRTSQASLLPPPPLWTKPKAILKNERPPASWENWPTAGGMRNGSLFQRPMLVPAMSETAGSVSLGARDMSKIDPERQKRADTKRTTGLPTEAAMWLTPNVPNGGQSVSEALVQSKGTTPAGEKKTVGLESQTKHWPTLAARDAKGANSSDHVTTNGTGRMHMDQLPNFVQHHFLHPDHPTQRGQELSKQHHGLPQLLPIHLAPRKNGDLTPSSGNGSWAGQSVGLEV